MRIVDIRHASVPISRYADPALPSGGLDTSVVAVATDAVRDGRPVVGYGFGSIDRFSQDGLIRDRFAPRLLRSDEASLLSDDGANLDPFRAWDAMMAGEKPGGHGERCVAVGTLDMAIWDAAAKIARQPLYRFLSQRLKLKAAAVPDVPVYAGGGYYYRTGTSSGSATRSVACRSSATAGSRSRSGRSRSPVIWNALTRWRG